MTITPMPVLPPAGRAAGTPGDGRAGQPSAADDFAALLDGALTGECVPDEVAAGAPLGDVAADPTQPDPAAVDPAAPLLAGTVPAAAPAQEVPPVGPTVAAEGGSPLTAALPVSATPSAGLGEPAGRTHASMAITAQETPGAAAGDTTAHETTAGPIPATSPVADPGHESAQPQVAPPAAETATTIPAGVRAPATVSDVGAPTQTGSTTPSGPSSPVLAQVTPALGRVVSRGDGEHRMMLKLHPADLGEVQLTVTVRGDHVDVEIAAGAEARELLREGSAQLRSLLESVGRTTGQLVLRDLPVGPAQPGAGLGGGPHDSGPGTTYGGTGDGRRDRPDTGGDRRHGLADPAADHPATTAHTSSRPHVAGASALDVTV